MSGNHNMYCSANDVGLILRLRGAAQALANDIESGNAGDDWVSLMNILADAADELERCAEKHIVDAHWPKINMDISEGVCGTCKLGAKNCDVDLDGHCGGVK